MSQRLGQLPEAQVFWAFVAMALLLLVCACIIAWQRATVVRSMRDLGILVTELEKVTAELNVERVWRLAGHERAELPEETLKKLYRHVGQDRLAG